MAAAALIGLHPDAFIGHYFNPKLLGITHLLTLGWVSMVISGALYQLLPVVWEVKLFGERLGSAAFGLLGAGAVAIAVSFWQFRLGDFCTGGGHGSNGSAPVQHQRI